MKKNVRIFVAGHSGMVGSAIVRALIKNGYTKIITRTKKQLNLLDKKKTSMFLEKNKPNFIFIAAAKVGGILANNKFKSDFLYENLTIQNNLINGAFSNNIKNLMFLGSSCIYPKNCKKPIKEKYLLTGVLEETNEAYAIAKIAGLKLCEYYNNSFKTNYRVLMPTNLYGINDNYHEQDSHVIPALISKLYKAKKNKKKIVKIWGSGKPKRDFMYVDDLAEACIFFMNKNLKNQFLNIGSGKSYTILKITKIIKKILNYEGEIRTDISKPDGTLDKSLDISKATVLGWKGSQTTLEDGLRLTIIDYIKKFHEK
jgi:GDP-L-fucose synthase